MTKQNVTKPPVTKVDVTKPDGRPPLGDKAMTGAERMLRLRAKARASKLLAAE